MTGKACLALLSTLLILSGVTACVGAETPPRIVSYVDLSRYMGTWHEIAAIPAFFQRRCTANTRADYELLPKGLVKVLNSCGTAEGRRIQSEGRARVEDVQSNAKLRVTFAKALGRWWYPLGGDYWVLDLAEDYSWVIVGHPSRRYGWILARNPSLDPKTLAMLAARLESEGYDPCEFMTMPQSGGLTQRKPLCEVVR